MILINDYFELFHNYSLPSLEKCFELEEEGQNYIKKWITKDLINGDLKDIFARIEKIFK